VIAIAQRLSYPLFMMKKFLFILILCVLVTTVIVPNLYCERKSLDDKTDSPKKTKKTGLAKEDKQLAVKWTFSPKDMPLKWEGYIPVILSAGESNDIFIFSKKNIIKLNGVNGKQIAAHPLGGKLSAPPITLNSKILYQINSRQFQLIDTAGEYKPVWICKQRMKDVLSFSETEAGVAVVGSSGKLISLDKADGKRQWELSLNNPLSYPPVVNDGGLYIFVVDNNRNFYKISASSGKIFLKVQLDNNITSPPLYFKERIYFATEGGLFIAFDADDLESDWEFDSINSTVAKAIGYDHMVCFATLGNHVYCRNRRSGSLELRARADKRLYISPLIIDDYLLAFPFSGSIVAVSIINPKIKGKFTYEKRIVAPVLALPTLRLLLVMTKEGALEALSYSPVFAMQPPKLKKKPRRQKR